MNPNTSFLEIVGRDVAETALLGGHQIKSIGQRFIESTEFRSREPRIQTRTAVNLPTGFLANRNRALATRNFNSASLAPVNMAPQQGLVGLGVQRLTIMDLFASGTTTAAAIPFPRENGFGSIDGVPIQAGQFPRAGTVGERGVKRNWDPDLTTETANVRKIAITTKVPDEFLSDFPAIGSFIDSRLPYMVDMEAEYQLLYGDGMGVNLKGLTVTEGIQTRAYTGTYFETIKKAITDVEVGAQFEVDGIAFHPYDWETASLEKDSEGRYLAGGPFYIPGSGKEYIQMFTYWSKPVVISTSVKLGQPIVGAWKLGGQFFLRDGVGIETTNSNEDDFRRGLVCMRAEERGALAVYRPVSFLEITGAPGRL